MIFASTLLFATLSLAQPANQNDDNLHVKRQEMTQSCWDEGSIMACPPGKVEENFLCYKPCAEGYKGVGPVCWRGWRSYGRGVGTGMRQQCPDGGKRGMLKDLGAPFNVPLHKA